VRGATFDATRGRLARSNGEAAVNRQATSRQSLVALARSRRVQRALAHAYIHRGAPMPTLRASLGFLTATTAVADAAPTAGHRMQVVGISPVEHVAYVVEALSPGETVFYRLFLRGPRQGFLVPAPLLAPDLVPIPATTAEAWMLSTRVVQRRAVRVAGQDAPIRTFALQLAIDPVSGLGASGKTTVTACLQPSAKLVEVLAIPRSSAAIARVTYTGIPAGPGASKDTVILLTQCEA
jgi:hypothetical protein